MQIMNIIDMEMCPDCRNIHPTGSICNCQVEKRVKTEVHNSELKLLESILIDIDKSIPSEPVTERARKSWREKYTDVLYVRNIIEEKRRAILNDMVH